MRSNSRAGYKIFEVKILFINLRILSLTGKKIQKVKTKCQNLSTETKPLMLELKTSILFFEVTTVQTVLAAKLQYWYLQLQQIASLKVK